MIHAFGRWGELRIGPRWGWVRTLLHMGVRDDGPDLQPWPAIKPPPPPCPPLSVAYSRGAVTGPGLALVQKIPPVEQLSTPKPRPYYQSGVLRRSSLFSRPCAKGHIWEAMPMRRGFRSRLAEWWCHVAHDIR